MAEATTTVAGAGIISPRTRCSVCGSHSFIRRMRNTVATAEHYEIIASVETEWSRPSSVQSVQLFAQVRSCAEDARQGALQHVPPCQTRPQRPWDVRLA